MRTLFGFGMVTALILGGTTSAIAQNSISVTPKTEANPNPPPPAGQKQVYAEGTWSLQAGMGWTVHHVKAKWYKEDGNNLIWVGTMTDNAPAAGTYKTGSFNVDTTNAQGVLLKYTVIVELYRTGNPNPIFAAQNIAQHYQP